MWDDPARGQDLTTRLSRLRRDIGRCRCHSGGRNILQCLLDRNYTRRSGHRPQQTEVFGVLQGKR